MMMLKVLLLTVAMISQFMQFKFQGSSEGKDERGRIIQLETNSFLYGVTYLGVILLIVLNLLDIVKGALLEDILLYLFVSLSIFGAVFTSWKKRI
jgi:hypothetical protein